MLAADRLLEIEEKFGAAVQRIVPAELDEATLRVILYLRDGSNLRVTEQWELGELGRYSYYWLTFDNDRSYAVGLKNLPGSWF